MHRGNNRQDLFENEEDMTRIKEDIAQALSKSDCSQRQVTDNKEEKIDGAEKIR
jgi:hypothetical protein